VVINGDGSTSRDFCYVSNAVQANLRAALASDNAQNQVFNVAVGERTSLLELFDLLRECLQQHQVHYARSPRLVEFRPGDVRHSQADIGKAASLLGYKPTHDVRAGLSEALPWYLEKAKGRSGNLT
jgi:UDP-N-acetylglucosamine 4-epimerase